MKEMIVTFPWGGQVCEVVINRFLTESGCSCVRWVSGESYVPGKLVHCAVFVGGFQKQAKI